MVLRSRSIEAISSSSLDEYPREEFKAMLIVTVDPPTKNLPMSPVKRRQSKETGLAVVVDIRKIAFSTAERLILGEGCQFFIGNVLNPKTQRHHIHPPHHLQPQCQEAFHTSLSTEN